MESLSLVLKALLYFVGTRGTFADSHQSLQYGVVAATCITGFLVSVESFYAGHFHTLVIFYTPVISTFDGRDVAVCWR